MHVISYDDLLGIASETDPTARIERAAQGLLEATAFRGAVVTYAPEVRGPHAVLFSQGSYSPENLTHLSTEFVIRDEQYRAATRHGAVAMTWDETGFHRSFTAETWLKPAGYRNGASLAVVDEHFGELGSIHVNTIERAVPEASLRSVRALAAYLAVHMRQLRRRDQLGLTAREIEITRLLARGDTNPEIAAELHLSRSTVGTHVESILRKMGASTRVRAAVEAVRLGIV